MKIIIGCILLVLILLFAFIVPNLKIPNEIGLIGDTLASLPRSPNAVSSQTNQKDKYVEPLYIDRSVKESQEKITKILTEIGCHIVTKSETYIHATSTSDIFHFRDDLEFFFDQNQQRVHFRSASRVGYSDLGVNRDRYMKIKKLYESQ